jgi:hypothetical protein
MINHRWFLRKFQDYILKSKDSWWVQSGYFINDPKSSDSIRCFGFCQTMLIFVRRSNLIYSDQIKWLEFIHNLSTIDLSLTSNEVESLKKSLILAFSAKGKSKEHYFNIIQIMRKLGDTEVAGDMTVILTSQK